MAHHIWGGGRASFTTHPSFHKKKRCCCVTPKSPPLVSLIVNPCPLSKCKDALGQSCVKLHNNGTRRVGKTGTSLTTVDSADCFFYSVFKLMNNIFFLNRPSDSGSDSIPRFRLGVDHGFEFSSDNDNLERSIQAA